MNPAEQKILAILADIVAYEYQHHRDGYLLSEQCDRWVQHHPILARLIIWFLGLTITAHLSNSMPIGLDWLSKRFWRKIWTLTGLK